MSDNHYIDIIIAKTINESPFKLEINETSVILTANLGKIEYISFSEEIFSLKFHKGHLRVELTFEDICKYYILEKQKKEL